MVAFEQTRAAPRFGHYGFSGSPGSRYRLFKRSLDIIVACGIGVTIFIPLFLVLGPLLWIGGPIFYWQTRFGAAGRRFRCYKFRTMVCEADRVLQQVLAQYPDAQSKWDRYRKIPNDPRITWIGRILRATSLDELPQLWNVIKGDMSLVGPRPIVEEEIPRYGKYFSHYVSVRPGITGMWQVYGRPHIVGYRRRVAMDVWYARHHNLCLDCLLMAKTMRIMIGSKGS